MLGRPGITPSSIEDMRALRAQGHSLRVIADKLGVGRGTVEKYTKGIETPWTQRAPSRHKSGVDLRCSRQHVPSVRSNDESTVPPPARASTKSPGQSISAGTASQRTRSSQQAAAIARTDAGEDGTLLPKLGLGSGQPGTEKRAGGADPRSRPDHDARPCARDRLRRGGPGAVEARHHELAQRWRDTAEGQFPRALSQADRLRGPGIAVQRSGETGADHLRALAGAGRDRKAGTVGGSAPREPSR